jgi:hypothetical protein
MQKEFRHIDDWLRARTGMAADSAVGDLLDGKPIQFPQLKLIWQHIVYHSHLVIAGRSLPDTEVSHAAFVLIWESENGPPATYEAGAAEQAADNNPRAKWEVGARYAIGPTGCRIVFLDPSGAASRAGVRVGDIITEAQGSDVRSPDFTTDRLIRMIKTSPSGELNVKVLRGDTLVDLAIAMDPAS